MSPRFLGFLVAFSIVCAIIDALVNASTPDESAIGRVLAAQVLNIRNVDLPLLPPIPIPIPNKDFIGAVAQLATLDYSFFVGPLALVRLVIAAPLWIMVIYGLTISIGPLILSAVSNLIRLARGG